jgi:hypothetical protein
MTTGATGQLGLALPVQGELSGTWGDTVNNGLTQYVNIAIAGTLSFSGDGAITLANTTGDSSATNIGSTTAQYMAIRVTGALTTAKIITAPSYSKIYLVENAATGSTVTFKAAGQTGVSIAVNERSFVYYNGTDYVKISGNVVSLTSNVTGILPVANGGSGTATPAIVAGSGVTVSGTWPNQTINATGTGGTVTSVAGTGTANGLTLSGTVTTTGNITLSGNVTSLTTTNFSISEVGGVLVFKYGATTIATMNSTGNLTTLNNITAYGSI